MSAKPWSRKRIRRVLEFGPDRGLYVRIPRDVADSLRIVKGDALYILPPEPEPVGEFNVVVVRFEGVTFPGGLQYGQLERSIIADVKP